MVRQLALALAVATSSCVLSNCALVDSRANEVEAGLRASHAGQLGETAPRQETSGDTLEATATDASTGGWLGLTRSGMWARWNAMRGDAYALDEHERFLEERGTKLACDRTGLVSYSGTEVRYHGPVQINEHFATRLERFEAVVARTAEEIYGRAPRRIRHYGAYSCRTSRNRSHRLSEHALGNAIDVVGFDFGPVRKGEAFDPALPKALRHAFQVRVARHWEGRESPVHQTHTRFLRTLVDRLLERDDVFRGVIGPGHRGHADHFHFDMSPWRFVRL